MRKILSGAVMMLVMASSASVEAAPAYSWNLSRDMMNSNGIAPNSATNPFGVGKVWTVMYDTVGTSHVAANYRVLTKWVASTSGSPISLWGIPGGSTPFVGVVTQTYNFNNGLSNFTSVQGMPLLHPDTKNSSIIRWKSPITGNINIMGRITDIDSACGNGIDWFVDKDNFTLMSGTLATATWPITNGGTILQQNIPVSYVSVKKGTNLYFIVSPKNNDYLCDSTELDIIITSP